MTDEELKQVDRSDLQDEIISILFRYLIKENKKKDKVIKTLAKERKVENVNSNRNN